MLDLSGEFSAFADKLNDVVSGPSVAGRPAGSSDAGSKFEQAIGELWQDFARIHRPTLHLACINEPNTRGRVINAYCLRNASLGTEMFFPPAKVALHVDVTEEGALPETWLRRKYPVSGLIEGYLGKGPYPFAPPTPRDSTNYYGTNYPSLFAGRTTNFDWCVALAERGAIVEKMLFEYKFAKSSGEVAVDGNAHERLSFQALQYLEVASQLPSCSFNVLMSSAFVQYKNKYHPAFNAQALRLSDAYRWFCMRVFSCHSEYAALFAMISRFLLEGIRPICDYRSFTRTR